MVERAEKRHPTDYRNKLGRRTIRDERGSGEVMKDQTGKGKLIVHADISSAQTYVKAGRDMTWFALSKS